MRFCFICPTLNFDVATPTRMPLGGSESCTCYLATELALRGHDVVLLSRNTNPSRVVGVDCRDVVRDANAAYFAARRFDVVVVTNVLAGLEVLVDRLLPLATPVVYWCHHDADQPAVTALGNAPLRRRIAAIVCVSEYQRAHLQRRFMLEPASTTVIGNGLTPAFAGLFASARELATRKRPPGVAVYTSTPFRGLDLLFDVMGMAPRGITLRVFSGMGVYQRDDRAFEPLLARGRSLPGVDVVGAVAQPRLAKELARASILAYPCSFAETFCIAAIEAIAAGLDIVTTNLGALPSTCAGFATLLPRVDDYPDRAAFVAAFRKSLADSLATRAADPVAWAERQFARGRAIERDFAWLRKTDEWEALFARVLATKLNCIR